VIQNNSYNLQSLSKLETNHVLIVQVLFSSCVIHNFWSSSSNSLSAE